MKKLPKPLNAKTADRHQLYQLSVQSVDFEAHFFHRTFKKYRKRLALSLREDFCGTALLSATWVNSHPQRTAVAVDIDPKVLAWGQENNVAPLGEAAERLQLRQADVRSKHREKFDIINAMNFSYWIFTTRDEMRDYFAQVRKGLVDDGIFFLDLYGGWSAQEPKQEPRKIRGGFTYVWDQASFDPIHNRVVNHIHFEFKDGSRLKRAFTYDWRFWSLPEIRELLLEAGFSQVEVYWENDGDLRRRRRRVQNQPGWLAYLAALK